MADQKKVLLLVSGGIAAYKSCEVLRALQKHDVDVRVVMSESAHHFVGKTTFEALSKHPVLDNLFDFAESPVSHITLTSWADVVLVCPATATIMAKMVAGLADDAASACLLAANSPVLIAPAMNTRMWLNSATQENLITIQDRGVEFILPVEGELACGDVGSGKLAEVEQIVEATLAALTQPKTSATAEPNTQSEAGSNLALAGKHVLITAGPTHEAIDPVRYISNASSGKMGYALARAARAAGAHVTLISGPVSLSTPEGVERIDVQSAQDMYEAAHSAFTSADVAILAAAVADYTPVSVADHKLKKTHEPLSSIALKETPDILASLAQEAQGTNKLVVGFAAETNDLLANARAKLERKACDLIVANDVSRPESSFGSDTNKVYLVGKNFERELELAPKDEVAAALIDTIATML